MYDKRIEDSNHENDFSPPNVTCWKLSPWFITELENQQWLHGLVRCLLITYTTKFSTPKIPKTIHFLIGLGILELKRFLVSIANNLYTFGITIGNLGLSKFVSEAFHLPLLRRAVLPSEPCSDLCQPKCPIQPHPVCFVLSALALTVIAQCSSLALILSLTSESFYSLDHMIPDPFNFS